MPGSAARCGWTLWKADDMTMKLARRFRATGSGHKPLGLLADGTPIWPMVGAAPDGDPDDDSGSGGDDADDDDDDPGDGDADGKDSDGKGKDGKGKTQAEQDAERVAQARKEAQKHRRALAPWKAIAKDYGLTPEEVRARLDAKPADGGKDDKGTQQDTERAVRDARREEAQKANSRIVKAEVKALAADTFADPADAVAFLASEGTLRDIEVDDDGEVDADDIRSHLADLLERKPHLAKQTDGKQRKTPAPDKSQGSGNRGTKDKSKGKGGSVEDGAELYRQLTGRGQKNKQTTS